MKILKIDTEHLHNNEHRQLMGSLLQAVQDELALAAPENSDSLNEGIVQLLEILAQQLETEDRAINFLRKSELTALIADADALRDSMLRGLALHIKTFSHSMDAEKREAARQLQVLLDNVGDFRRDNYSAESGIIGPFLNELQENHTQNIEAIGAGEWVNSIKNANQEFDKLIEERSKERVDAMTVTGKKARREVDKTYRQLMNSIEVAHIVSGGSMYIELINRMNEYIGSAKTMLAQRKGRAAAEKKNKNLDGVE